jgi:membrane associated rhomboid family serine protease
LPVHNTPFAVIVFLLCLIVWYAVTRGATPLFPSLRAEEWISIGAADALRMAQGGQWHRAITSLTLHGDSPHMLGNVLFGAVFMVLLCRRTGFGPGLFLCLLAGALGNILNAWLQPPQHMSIGFSTSLFGTVGALCGLYGASAQKTRLWVILGAGLALLALLGSEGARTDIMAHLFGLICGFFSGTLLGAPLRRYPEFFTGRAWRLISPALGAIAILGTAGAWAYALNLRFAAL